MKQYVIKTVRDTNEELIYFNFGMSKHKNYVNTCIGGLTDNEYICITVFTPNEFEDYNESVKELLSDCKAKLCIQI